MPNRLYNKQVTPKGYKMGGKVMGDRVGFDKGMGVKETGFKHKGRLKKLYKEIVGRDRKFRDPKDALMALTKADAGATFIKGLEKKGINWSKMKNDILKEKMKSTEFRVGTAKGKSKASDDDEKKYRVYKKGGEVKVRSMKKDPIADYVRSVKEIRKPKGAKRLGKMGGGMMDRRFGMKKGSKFPDLTGDGKVTFADILKGRGVINGKKKKKGEIFLTKK